MSAICGGRPTLTKIKPKNWTDEEVGGYHIMVPYTFKWRETIGRFTCDCTEVHEVYQPWYGFTWSHSNDCTLMKQVRFNETRYGWMDVGVIAQSE